MLNIDISGKLNGFHEHISSCVTLHKIIKNNLPFNSLNDTDFRLVDIDYSTSQIKIVWKTPQHSAILRQYPVREGTDLVKCFIWQYLLIRIYTSHDTT